ncbi:hypothetical protein QUF75_19070 [Desulfococcaceae bacterium HSG7]|nr:hypothetical protein [Desulfococcaceae bacterium HSG7]
MKIQKNTFVLIILFLTITILPVADNLVFGESSSPQTDNKADPSAEVPEKKAAEAKPTITTLATIIHYTKDLKGQIEDMTKKLDAAETKEQKIEIQGRINELNVKLHSFEKNFELISTGVYLEAFEKKTQKEFDWNKELRRILSPIFQELKKITERSRQIEKLSMELARYESLLGTAKGAIKNIENLVAQAKDEDLKKQLKEKLYNKTAESLTKQLEDKYRKEEELKFRKESEAAYKKKIDVTLKEEPNDAKRKELEKKLKKEAAEKISMKSAQRLNSDDFKKELHRKLKKGLEIKFNDQKLKKELAEQLRQELDILEKELKSLAINWKHKEHEINSQHIVTTYRLKEELSKKKSILQSIQNILQVFFKSRGRNFFFASLAFFSFWLLFHLFYRLVCRFSPIRKAKQRSFAVRLAGVIYMFMTVISAVNAFLITLYLFGDWVLLILSLIFLLGVAWTAKQGLPVFWEQLNLLLNLGTVRENERVVYNGVPWKVVSLNIYTHLENPALKSGKIRLPIRDMIELRSRPFQKDEPWFPCQENDWVLLKDGSLRKVVSQSSEMVDLVSLGGDHTICLTQNFLNSNPKNLSRNFRLKTVFGIDYKHQAVCTQEIPDKLREMLINRMNEEGFDDKLIGLKVEFKQAAASSLDFEIIADFSGKASRYHNMLSRAIQRICVEACNKYGWDIPFTQVTVHTADSPPTGQ